MLHRVCDETVVPYCYVLFSSWLPFQRLGTVSYTTRYHSVVSGLRRTPDRKHDDIMKFTSYALPLCSLDVQLCRSEAELLTARFLIRK